jgi:hypothetical protein
MKQETITLIQRVIRLFNARHYGEVFKYYTDTKNDEDTNYAVVHEQLTPCLKIWYGKKNILMITTHLELLEYYDLERSRDFVPNEWKLINLHEVVYIFDRYINETDLTLFLEETLIALI